MFALETRAVRDGTPARRPPRGQATSEMLVIAGVVVAILLGVLVAFRGEIAQAVGTLSARIQCAVSGGSNCSGGTVSVAAPPGTDANAYGLVTGAPGSGGAGGNTATGTPTLPPGGGTATGTAGLPPGGGTATGTATLPPGGGTATGTTGLPPGGGTGRGAANSPGGWGVNTGLGEGVDAIVTNSMAFKGNLLVIARKGYHVTFGEEGKGSFCNRTKKLIVIDSKWKGNDLVIASILAHEVGHAIYDPKHDPIPKIDDPKFIEWVDAQVKKSLDDEGEAILKEFQIRDYQIKDRQTPIPISGVKSAEYEKIWQQFQQDHDRAKARSAIGEIVGKYEHPSTAPDKTYKDYYEEAWAEAWALQDGINLSGVR